MSELTLVLLLVGTAVTITAVLFVAIEFEPPTPFSNDSMPPLLNLLALVGLWLPLMVIGIIVAGLLRLVIPANCVNTESDRE